MNASSAVNTDVVDANRLDLFPTVAAGASQETLRFNNSYSIWVDNAGSGGNNTRLWIDGPDLGDFTVGPRSGASQFGQIRLRTSATGATGNPLYMDSGGVIRRNTSSIRYKEQVQPVEVDQEALSQIEVVRYKEKAQVAVDGEDAPWRLGVIAEQVAELGLTDLVSYDYGPDGELRPEGFRYDLLALGLLQKVKVLEDRLASLEAS